jgi:outer membrane protein TolC
MGVTASDGRRLVPISPLGTARVPVDWEMARSLAEEMRPDLIELKLILEADEQELLLARNTALPRLDAEGLYRWNGLEGHTPSGNRISSNGEFADWAVGVNFSVPLGLRRERALVRQRELLIMRDRANLDQGLHAASHRLAASIRSLDQNYAQYQAFRRVREAALTNLEQQIEEFRGGRPVLLLNVLQAITDWGNAVSNENQSLALYNTELSNLELETGTILESRGVRFFEERYGSIGPMGRMFRPVCYPRDMRPSLNLDREPPAKSETYQRPETFRLPSVEELPQGR